MHGDELRTFPLGLKGRPSWRVALLIFRGPERVHGSCCSCLGTLAPCRLFGTRWRQVVNGLGICHLEGIWCAAEELLCFGIWCFQHYRQKTMSVTYVATEPLSKNKTERATRVTAGPLDFQSTKTHQMGVSCLSPFGFQGNRKGSQPFLGVSKKHPHPHPHMPHVVYYLDLISK